MNNVCMDGPGAEPTSLDTLRAGNVADRIRGFDQWIFSAPSNGWLDLCGALVSPRSRCVSADHHVWVDSDDWPAGFDEILRRYFERRATVASTSDAEPHTHWIADDKFLLAHAILTCARTIARHYTDSFATPRGLPETLCDHLRTEAEQLGVPQGLLLDAAHEILRGAVRAPVDGVPPVTVQALLIKSGGTGVVGDLTVSLMSDGGGALYGDVHQSFVWLDEQFGHGLEQTTQYLRDERKLWPTDRDIRWRLKLRGTDAAWFAGASAGGAFALAIEQLLVAGKRSE